MARWFLLSAALLSACGDDGSPPRPCASSVECEGRERCVNGACVTIDADAGAAWRPTSAVITAGGVTVLRTSEYGLRISVGAPVPQGQAASSTHRLRLGPQPR